MLAIETADALNRSLREAFARIRAKAFPMLADPDNARTEVVGHFGASKGDVELVADRLMRDIVLDTFLTVPTLKQLVRSYVFEGHDKPIEGRPGAPYVAYVDQLDNSQGFEATARAQSRRFCPSPHAYACVITLVDEQPGVRPLFRDIVAGGIQALHGRDPTQPPLIGLRDVPWDDAYRLPSVSDPLLFDRMSKGEKIGVGTNRTIILEGYYPDNRALADADFSDVTGPIRSFGCAGLEMGMVAAGHVAAYVTLYQKLDELGAAARVNQAAGAAICTWVEERDRAYETPDNPEGLVRRRASIWDQPYAWGTKMPAIFAADEVIMAELCRRMRIR